MWFTRGLDSVIYATGIRSKLENTLLFSNFENTMDLFHELGFVIFFFRFVTLRDGLKNLKHEESRRAADPLVFVKENVATFLDAVDTLKSILTASKPGF